MPGWNSRIQIRRDSTTRWTDIPHNLDKGEMAIANDGGVGEIRIGVTRQPWEGAPVIAGFGPGLAPLTVQDNNAIVAGDLIAFQNGKPVSGAKQIDFETSSVSGAVVYTHSTATFSTDPSVVLTNDLDGGDYKSDAFVDTEAPAFSPTYSPQIGGSGTTEPYSEPTFAPSYQPSLGQA